jgi:hypothetical protein
MYKKQEASMKPQRALRYAWGKSEHQKLVFSICSVYSKGFRGTGKELNALLVEGTEKRQAESLNHFEN